MKLHPFHDASGVLWPELDTRDVSVSVFCRYLSLSRWRVTVRARRGEFGRTQAEGAWFQKSRTGTGGEWRFRPAVIFRRLRMGRFAMVDFDPRQVDGRIRLYHCDPELTAQRDVAAPAAGPELADAFRHTTAALSEALALVRRLQPASAAPLNFPAREVL